MFQQSVPQATHVCELVECGQLMLPWGHELPHYAVILTNCRTIRPLHVFSIKYNLTSTAFTEQHQTYAPSGVVLAPHDVHLSAYHAAKQS